MKGICGFVLVLAIILLGYSPLRADPSGAPDPSRHDFSRWQAIVQRELDGHLAGGYAFAVMYRGKVVASGAHGWARTPDEATSPSVPWQLSTSMGLASVSKTITAVALLHLWDEKKRSFSLDDPFWPYLKSIVPTASAEVQRITIRQLLMHRSGFAPMSGVFSPQAVEKLLQQPLAHPPGSTFSYDNKNYYILRLLIEQIGQVDYTAYVKEEVLKPMGIEELNTHPPASPITCYYGKPTDRKPGHLLDGDSRGTAGASGWYGSVDDLCKFLHALRQGTVLSKEASGEMFRDNLGWDESVPGHAKAGFIPWTDPPAGELHSAIAYFPDDVEAVMLINCHPPIRPRDLLILAWLQTRQQK